LTCSTDRVSVSGILEPAYSIGGDSFDFALNSDRLEFAIVDAVGHGMAAVMISVLADQQPAQCPTGGRRPRDGLSTDRRSDRPAVRSFRFRDRSDGVRRPEPR
jgi:serine phosphatase RsbU (regulator of sigma subunit)